MSLDKTKVCQELKVLKKIQETVDTISLVLEVPRTTGGKFSYKAGQFVTLFLDIDGEEVRRSYSLASSPDYETEFKISVKLVTGGKGSTYLVQKVQEGQKLWVTPPAGHFCLPATFENQKFGFFAAGSGVTPIISLIKSALKGSPTTSCALLYQNRYDHNIIFRDELVKLEREFAPRFKVEHIVSQPGASWVGLKGRVDDKIIRDFLTRQALGIRSMHYMCGPDAFMQVIESALFGMGLDKSKVIKESFSTATTATPSTAQAATVKTALAKATDGEAFTLDEDAVVIGDRAQVSHPETVTALLDGETHTVPYKKGQTVLEALLEADLNPPYSCLDGACMACIGKVQEGVVYQNDMGILTEDNVEAKECLTCQARPASKNVKVNYEIF